jgi:Primase C terminal 2 (PriCT-2)/D5 N terminal like
MASTTLGNILNEQNLEGLYNLVLVHKMPGVNMRKATLDSERVADFMREYAVAVAAREAHIAEMPRANMPILIDVDVKEEADTPRALYSARNSLNIAVAVARGLADVVPGSVERVSVLELVLLTKAPRLVQNGEQMYNKHGFHMHALNATVSRRNYSAILERAKRHLGTQTFKHLPSVLLATALDDISGKPWLMYGSTKADGEEPFLANLLISVDMSTFTANVTPYPADESLVDTITKLALTIPPAPTMAHVVDADGHDESDDEEEERVAPGGSWNTMARDMFMIAATRQMGGEETTGMNVCSFDGMSAENTRATFNEEDGEDSDEELAGIDRYPRLDVEMDNDETVEAIRCLLLHLLSETRADSHDYWLRCCFALAHITINNRLISTEVARRLFHEFSHRSPKYNSVECDAVWERSLSKTPSNKEGVTIGTLYRWAVEDQEDILRELGSAKLPMTLAQVKAVIANAGSEKPAEKKKVAPRRKTAVTTKQAEESAASDEVNSRPKITARRRRLANDEPAREENRYRKPISEQEMAMALVGLEQDVVDLVNVADGEDNPRRSRASQMLKLALKLLSPTRFEMPESVALIQKCICTENLLGRIKNEEAVELLDMIIQLKNEHGYAEAVAINTERLRSTLVKEQEWYIFRGGNSTKMCTVGALFGMVQYDLPDSSPIKDVVEFKLATRKPAYLKDMDLAQSIKRWLPVEVTSHGPAKSPPLWYEYNTTIWRYNPNFDNNAAQMYQVWFNEIVQYRVMCGMPVGQVCGMEEAMDEVVSDLHKLHHCVRSSSSIANITRTLNLNSRMDYKGLGNDFDSNKHLMAFLNVVYDRTIGDVRPGRPDDFLSRRIECMYIPEHELNPIYVKIIQDFFEKIHPRADKREYFLDSCANIFSGENPWKQYMVWTGAGHNGKSVCVKLFETMLGRLSWKLNKGVLIHNRHKEGGGPQPDMVRLRATRMVFTDEVGPGDVLDCGSIKLLSGNDTFPCRDLYRGADDIIRIDPAFIPVIVCNTLPKLFRPDPAAWGRMRVFEFESTFAADVKITLDDIAAGRLKVNPAYVYEADTSFIDKMLTPEVLSTFASMLLHRYMRNVKLQNEGVRLNVPPPCVRQGEIVFNINQNAVFRAIGKHYTFRSPFSSDTAEPGDDPEATVEMVGNEVVYISDNSYDDTVKLDEIMRITTAANPHMDLSVDAVMDLTNTLVSAYKPFLSWNGQELKGVRRVA